MILSLAGIGGTTNWLQVARAPPNTALVFSFRVLFCWFFRNRPLLSNPENLKTLQVFSFFRGQLNSSKP
jgi:hypothetical protein